MEKLWLRVHKLNIQEAQLSTFARGGLLQLFISHLSVEVMPKLLLQPRGNVHLNFRATNACISHDFATRSKLQLSLSGPLIVLWHLRTRQAVASRHVGRLLSCLCNSAASLSNTDLSPFAKAGLRLDLYSMASWVQSAELHIGMGCCSQRPQPLQTVLCRPQ